MKIGIVVSEFYWEDITSKMLDVAVKTAEGEGVEVKVIKVPGSFEIPLAVKKLLPHVEGVVTLGAVVQGETDHDGVISYTLASKITDLSLQFDKPVVLGVNGPKMTREQGIARISRTAEVVKACLKMIKAYNKNHRQ